MSIYYSIYCKTCSEESECNLNRGLLNIKWLIENKSSILALWEKDCSDNCFIDFQNTEYILFLKEHKEHELYIADEDFNLFNLNGDAL